MQTLPVLVVCLYVFNTAAEATTTAPTPKPSLACDSSGNLTYTGIPNWVLSATTDCGTAAVHTVSHTVVITGCPIGNLTTVHMYTHATPGPDSKIVKSLTEEVILRCTAAHGTYKANITFPGSVTPSMVTAKESISLTMALIDQITNKTATSVAIGNLYDLLITGAGNHFMKLVNCSAAATTSKTNPVTVFDAENNGNDPGVISPLTDNSTSDANTHPLKATLTGFRLVKSLTVYLECSVKVCDTPNCPLARKRKSTKSSLKTASLKFEVIDTQSPRHTNGGRGIHTTGKFSVITAMVIIVRYITYSK